MKHPHGRPDNLAISVDGVCKAFTIPFERRTLRQIFASPFRRVTSTSLTALDEIEFDVKRGEFFGVIGHNGCGKTTLLKILAGIYRPDRGEAAVRGKIAPLLELGTGFNPELSARDNVFINGCIIGIPLSLLKKRLDEIMAFAGVEKFVEMKVKHFSSGMVSRLAFSIASFLEADVYLMDEVFAVGDHDFKKVCLERLESLKRQEKTIVLVTHDLASIAEHCSRCILLDGGRMRFDGEPAEAIKAYLGNGA